MKKLKAILALSLTAACALGASGCSAAPVANAPLSSNWYVRTSYPGIQPYARLDENGGVKEILTYDISFVENSGGNKTYSVSFDEGATMTTQFYADYYDWNSDNIPEGYKGSKDTEVVYVYKTEFTLSGHFTFTATGETVAFNDSMVSESYFRSVRNDLQPVYSYQKVHSTSPAKLEPKNKDEMAVLYDYEIKTYYNHACTQATAIRTENAKDTKTNATLNATNPIFDNASLYTAMRALNIGADSSLNISLFIPVEGKLSDYFISSSDVKTLEDEDSGIKSALVDAGYITDTTVNEEGETVPTEVEYKELALTYNATLQGTTQKAWFANRADATNNVCRSTMLKVILPISFGLGTLEYSLRSIDSHLDI